jgi:phosphatidate cytidylyltransferase
MISAVKRREQAVSPSSSRSSAAVPDAPSPRAASARAAAHEPPEPSGPRPEPPRRNRAGRNLPAAIGVGAGLAALIVVSLLLEKIVFVGLIAAVVVLGLRELAGAFRERDVRIPLIPVTVGGLGMVAAAYFKGEDALAAALALTSIATVVWRLADGSEGFLRDASAGVFAAVYVPYLAGFAALLTAADHGAERALIFMLLVACNDTGGYIAGVLAGRHPMAPTISPKKSWEGLVGSLITAGAAGAVCVPAMLHGQAWQGAVLGAAAVFSATLGDLCESMIKRDLGIKDMGSLLPGHGGIMDRLDSLLPTAPVAWLLLTLFVPVK